LSTSKKLLVIDIAPFGWNLVSHLPEFQPALTCTAQASFRTASTPSAHGNVGKGFEIAWTSSLPLHPTPTSFLDLAHATQNWMTNAALK